MAAERGWVVSKTHTEIEAWFASWCEDAAPNSQRAVALSYVRQLVADIDRREAMGPCEACRGTGGVWAVTDRLDDGSVEWSCVECPVCEGQGEIVYPSVKLEEWHKAEQAAFEAEVKALNEATPTTDG